MKQGIRIPFSFITMLLLAVLLSVSATAQKKHALASYSQVHDKNRDGHPSKCDCDYRKKALVLSSDSTFLLTHTKGRIHPETELMEKGTWSIAKDSVLVLHVKHRSGLLKEEEDVNYSSEFTIHRGHLSQWDDVWKGSGLIRPSQNRNRRP